MKISYDPEIDATEVLGQGRLPDVTLENVSLAAAVYIEKKAILAGNGPAVDNGIKSMTGPRLREAVIRAPARL